MFHRVLPYKEVIDEMLRSNSDSIQLLLSSGEWQQLQHIKDFLQSFFEATVRLSSSYTPSAHELLQQLYNISKVYDRIRELEYRDETIAPIVDAMRTKFLKYWEEVPLVTIVANCLNPSLNKTWTVKMLQKYKRYLGLPSHNEEARVNFALETMFNIYNARRNSAQPPSSSTTRPNTSRRGLLDELRDEDDLITGYGITNELSSYTGLPPNMEDESIDILDYWKRHSSAYPTLAMMARDIFTVPISTVPSESYFSSANRILTDRRSKLGPNVFERLVCMKDWIEAENQMQHFVPGETSGAETQPSATGSEVDSEDEYDPKDTDLWYLRQNY
ncbi:hypothetical protein LUZ63_004635 [Rhynchospora breviuscula]|uniref:Transposase n=1 Tax=Rhynchospora breviuscula TaxID=2022672 RepID=A0A9Q0CLQ9_9POAL|nr:hypothetical protein LUZ63_004635 [Rhynchospora breviuscula]